MASFEIKWKKSATKELRLVPQASMSRIIKAVENLPYDPYPTGVRKIAGSHYHYRIRVGDYRIIYSVESSSLTIEIVRVRHRKDVYRP